MTKIDERTAANMDVVLEQVCRGLPHGGDHESREHIAQRLMQSAKKEMSLWVARCGQSRPYRAIQQQIGMKLTHRFAELTPENRPQDPNIGWDRPALRNDGARRRISGLDAHRRRTK